MIKVSIQAFMYCSIQYIIEGIYSVWFRENYRAKMKRLELSEDDTITNPSATSAPRAAPQIYQYNNTNIIRLLIFQSYS